MIEAVLDRLADPQWWADQILSYALFSLVAGLVAGWFANRLRRRAERRERAPYEGWTLRTLGFDDAPQTIYWEDMKRFLTSDVEFWRWIKSVCSTSCTVNSRTATAAKQHGWLVVDADTRRVTIDFERIPDGHAHDWRVTRPWLTRGDVAPTQNADRLPL